MNLIDTLKYSLSGAVIAAALSLAGPAVAAEPLPSYAVGTTDETIHGTVASVDGQYDISVRDARGFIDKVSLHQGTIINPTGLTLAPGQTVTILGRTQGNAFAANEIDTPYESVAAVPVYPAFGYGYGYPYYRGYGYRPYSAYGLGFGFGRSRFGFGF